MLADGEFFFLELNARIQVEHPVTELVTGLDLVEQQLRIASGERLDIDLREPEGHAVEARLYAEDPRTFLPRTGTITRLRLPEGIRVDQGVEESDEIPVAYDPLIAKLIAHEETRAEALDALAAALRDTEIRGVETNLPFLRWLVDHPELRAGEATTAFLDENPPLSRPRESPPPVERVLAAERPGPGPHRAADGRGQRARRPPRRPDHADRPHARRRHPRAHLGRGPRRGSSATCRPRGDEDGDSARVPL